MSEPQPVGSEQSDDAQTASTPADAAPLTTDEETQQDDGPVKPGNS